MSVAGQIEYERRLKEQKKFLAVVTIALASPLDKKGGPIKLVIAYGRADSTYFIRGQPIQQINVDIGSKRIDEAYKEWSNIWSNEVKGAQRGWRARRLK